MDKTYLTNRTEYLLQKAIEEETQRLKDRIAFNPESNIKPICTEIGILIALKEYVNDIIKEL